METKTIHIKIMYGNINLSSYYKSNMEQKRNAKVYVFKNKKYLIHSNVFQSNNLFFNSLIFVAISVLI